MTTLDNIRYGFLSSNEKLADAADDMGRLAPLQLEGVRARYVLRPRATASSTSALSSLIGPGDALNDSRTQPAPCEVFEIHLASRPSFMANSTCVFGSTFSM